MSEVMKKKIAIGCIADDFTGAGDAASYLAAGGMSPLLLIWPCEDVEIPPDCDSIVVALKSRSQEASAAIGCSLSAVHWLKECGAQKIYFKYCSTFDSRPDGNIGTVGDAIMESYNIPYTLLCPSMLPNERSVKDGILYVYGVPLAQSHMKNHPLNPMWESSVKELMKPQSKYPCFELPADMLNDSKGLFDMIERLRLEHSHFYLVPDFYEARHGIRLAEFFGKLDFLTGASELLKYLAADMEHQSFKTDSKSTQKSCKFGRFMVAGSCSEMSRLQIKTWIKSGGRAIKVDTSRLCESANAIMNEIVNQFLKEPEKDMLVYSSGSSANVDLAQPVEGFNAELSYRVLQAAKIERLVVAGGETSGAVIKRLEFRAFNIGESVAPGVPVLYPVENKDLRIVLKSGNFGTWDFYLTTLKE